MLTVRLQPTYERLISALQKEHQDGRINDAIYRGIASAAQRMPDGRTVEQAADDYTRKEYRMGYPTPARQRFNAAGRRGKERYPADDLATREGNPRQA